MEYYEIIDALNELPLEERETIVQSQLAEIAKERDRIIRAKTESHIKTIRENIDALLDMDFEVRFKTEREEFSLTSYDKDEYLIYTI